jgi:hypothetical protein
MNRDLERKSRIKKIQYNDMLQKKNSYGGMGMDCIISAYDKKLTIEELERIKTHPEYIKAHPEIYKKI